MNDVQVYLAHAEPLSALIPLSGIIVLAVSLALGHRLLKKTQSPLSATDTLWALPAIVLLVILCAFCIAGLYVSENTYLIYAVMAITASGMLTMLRKPLLNAISRRSHQAALALSVFRDVLVVPLVIAIAFIVLELPWNAQLWQIRKLYVAVNLVIIAVPFLILYFVGNRRGAVLTIPLFVCCLLGLAQYFDALFKNAAIRPSDVFALGTALSVSSGYRFEIGAFQVLALAVFSLGVTLLSFVRPLTHEPETR